MKRRLFTMQEKQELLSNQRILKVLNYNIVFTQEFKDFALIEHYINGKSGCHIFSEAKIPDWLKTQRIWRNAKHVQKGKLLG